MKIVKWLDDNIELVIMGIALSVLTVVVLIDVIGRTALGTGITWGQEMSRNCEIVIAAMGAALRVIEKYIKILIGRMGKGGK